MPTHAQAPQMQGRQPIQWTGRNEGGVRGVKMFTRFSLITGLWLGPFLLAIGTWFFIPFLSMRRRGSEVFFTQFYGRRRMWLKRLWDTYRQFLAWTLCWHERVIAFARGPGSLRTETIGAEHVQQANVAGRGVLLLTAHVGNYELGAWCLARRHRGMKIPPIHMAMIDTEIEAVRKFLDGMRGVVKPNIIPMNQSAFSALPVMQALRRAEIVCMQGDRATGTRSTMVEFLGRKAPFPVGPYFLAKMTGAVVIPIICRRLGRGRYQFQLFAPLDVETPERAAAEYVKILENETLARPYYWFNLFSFWDGPHAPVEAD